VNNPTLTEFCFGMIGRADIEGSKSNVAMNAWLPQASSVIPASLSIAQSLLSLCGPVDDCTLSGGRSPYLRCMFKCTHTLASVELPSYDFNQGARSAADCLYSSNFYPSVSQIIWRCYHPYLVLKDLRRFPRIQVCCQFTHKHMFNED
jgi:hypothetical protein